MKTTMIVVGAILLHCPVPCAAQEDLAQVVAPGVQAPGQQQKVPDEVLVDEQPGLKKAVDPVYPPEALAKGVEGKVWLKVLVDIAGKPADVQVLKSENEVFNTAAMNAARQFVFTPALKDKKPVAVWVTLPFKFKLADKKSEEHSQKETPQDVGSASIYIQKVNLIFAGDPSARMAISPEAYLVDGSKFVNLLDAIFGADKGKYFVGEAARKQSFMKVMIADDKASATLVLKTEGATKGEPHWHTIGWTRDNSGTWKVVHWHTSR